MISLAAAQAERDRDFRQERLDIAKELEDIGVPSDRLAAVTQRVMEIEWAVFKAACMLEYHGLERDPRAIVELAKMMVRNGSP